MELQNKCNIILDDDSILDEIKIDMIQDIVIGQYGCTKKESEEIIMDILWRHKDPNHKRNNGYAKILSVEPILQRVEIPDLETRKEYSEQIKKQFEEKPSKSNTKENDHPTELSKEELIDQRKKQNFNSLKSVLNAHMSDQKIQEMLEQNNYDISTIINKMTSPDQFDLPEIYTPVMPDQAENQHVPEMYKPSPALTTNESKHAKVCSFFQKGNCFRSDCMFSHDVNTKICSYWLRGDCLAGASCLYLHEPDINKLAIKDTTPLNSPVLISAPLASPSKSNTSSPKINKFKFNPTKTFVPSAYNDPKKLPIIPPPMHVPWEQSDDIHLKKYLAFRKNAIKLEEKKSRNSKLSAVAYSNNNPLLAREYSKKAQDLSDKIEDAMSKADNELSIYSRESDGDFFLELSGLLLPDAKEQVEDVIIDFKKRFPEGQKAIYLILPSISSPSYKKLTKAINVWLYEKGYKTDLFGCGQTIYGCIVGFDPWSKT